MQDRRTMRLGGFRLSVDLDKGNAESGEQNLVIQLQIHLIQAERQFSAENRVLGP
jgi:hypothetical protein